MDWSTLADAIVALMYIAGALFLVYGAGLAVASVLPERWIRRNP